MMKKEKIGIFEPIARARGKKLSHITNKKNRTGFYDPEVIKKRIEKSLATQKRLKVGAYYNPEIRKKNQILGQITQKKNKIGFHNSKLQSILGRRGGKISGPLTAKKLRKTKNIIWRGVHFDSWKEVEIAMSIFFQFGIKLKEGKNCHIQIGSREYDFFVYETFLEYHPILPFYKESKEDYIINRRNNLNEQGYKNNPLLIIK
jgi:hypothetical protein